ncbi:MAG: hypothetical protein JWR19_117 [Pedosphaera sp.]|nr:hypothetical protein [Pedosphaera sp.]
MIVGIGLIQPARLFADGPGIGNLTYGTNELFTTLAAFTSTNGAPRGHGFVNMVHGYLTVVFSNDGGGGNGSGGFAFYDISNPRSPVNTFTTANIASYNDPSNTNYVGDLREAHAQSFWGDYACLPSNKANASGLEFWNWANIDPPNPNPYKVSQIALPGLSGGDYSPTPWWAFWQAGRYAYVAGTSGGLYIVDATDPSQPFMITRAGGQPNPIPTSQTGGFRINTVFAIGNLLVIAGSDVNGISTFDISDPANPVLLGNSTNVVGYSMMVNGNKILGANSPARVWDISNPTNIVLVGVGPAVADKGGYGIFQDGYFHYGSSSAYVKLDIRTTPFTAAGVYSPPGFFNPDWDFATPLGNILFLGSDHGSGSALFVHQLAPDTNPPAVNMVVPQDGAVNQALTSRVGLTFTDLIDLRTVTTNTIIVRPTGGTALPGRYSHQTGIVNFWPDQPFQSNITYEVVVPAGGIKDLVGNAISQSFTSRFTTFAISNAPLVCIAQPAPPATPGQLINFSASATGPGPVQFSWNFGDGTPATPPSLNGNVSHTYSNAGHFQVVVTADNGSVQATRLFTQTIYQPPTPVSPSASGTIILDAPLNRVWTVNPDDDTITAIDANNLTKLFEKPVGKNPRTLAQAPDGTIWVASQGNATINILNRNTGNPVQVPIALPRAAQPYGVTFSPDGSAAYVTLQATGHLLKLNPTTRTIIGDIFVGPTPRGLAISSDSQRILVTRFISPDTEGEVVEVNAASFTVVRTLTLAIDPGPDKENASRGVPNYLISATISPDGRRLWVPSEKDNIQRGLYRDGRPLTFESTVRTIVSQIDLQTNAEGLSARVDLNDSDMAVAGRFTPLGDYLFVAVQGVNTIDVIDAYSGVLVTAIEATGFAPQGLVLSPDGGKLFVQNFISRTVGVFDTKGIVASTNNLAASLAVIPTVSNEKLSAQELFGKQIFYNGHDARMNHDNYISCASCHLDGGQDGRVWDFTDRGEGLRNTITMVGHSGTGQGRVHWTGNFDEIQDFENDIRGSFGGLGFMSDAAFNTGTRSQPLGDPKAGLSPELDALAAYVSSLTNVNFSPYRNPDGSLTADGQAGKAIFASLNCASCHIGNQFTDSSAGVLHDVGTINPGSGQRLGQPLTGFDTPTLKGIWETPPYLHDGSAATLLDVITTGNTNGLHGATASLTSQQQQQLVAYLLQIDDSEFVNIPPVVSLVFPTNGMSFALPANVVLTAQASDSDGAVRSVEFFCDGISLGQVTNNPYSLIWTNPILGAHSMTARVTDNLDNFTTSSPVGIAILNGNYSLNVNFQPDTAPVPAGYLPDTGLPFGARTNGLSYGWNAATPDTRYRTANPSPDLRYATLIHLQKPANPNAVWEVALPNGSYQVHIISGDADFSDGFFQILAEGVTIINSAPTANNHWVDGQGTVNVQDGRLTISNGPSASNNKICFIDVTSTTQNNNVPPSISLQNPADNSTFAAPTNLLLTANATDSDGAVVRVDFYSGTNWLGATVSPPPYTFAWSNVLAGTYTLSAFATDSQGGTSASSPVHVNVTAPPVTPFAVAAGMGNGGACKVSFATISGRSYIVEFTSTLVPANWQTLQTVSGNGSTMFVTDTQTNTTRFYRVRAQ